mmetsp:Transcript_81405/g.141312  ORF Transcript_81405/g.141312 Transcript_81405/m.141312 type:complete len:281 (-) Transcript_81405:50-892(-)
MKAKILRCAFLCAGLALVAITLMGCQAYEVKMTYKCNKFQTNTCMEWIQEGAVQQPTSACFPREAMVTTRAGPKAMSELSIGEEILGFDHATGKPVFTAVRAFLHRDVHAKTAMTLVRTASGTITASPQHLLAVDGAAAYVFAAELKPGNILVAADGRKTVVKGVSETAAHGLYAPLTWTSNYFVGGPSASEADKYILAHSYAEFHNPRRYEAMFNAMLSVAEFLSPSVHDVNSADEVHIDPVAKFLMRLFGFAPPPTQLRRAIVPRAPEPAGEMTATMV